MRRKAHQGGGARRVEEQHAKGKLTARERLELLLDPGTFQEIEPFLALADGPGESSDGVLGEGVVTGFGQIDGRTVHVYAQDFTVMGGTLSEGHSRKICHIMDMAVRRGSPVIGLIDSGGARIQQGVRALGGYAELFRRNALYSGVIPQVSVMLGPCAGGAAYSPAITDFVIMVEEQSYMFITGPAVIRAVTGEEIDPQSLGGVDVHMALSGTAHLATPTEQQALALCRRVLSYLPANNVENPPYAEPADDPGRMDEALNSIVPLDPSIPYSMHEVIDHLVDRGSFLEVQERFALNAIVGLARIGGHSVGVVAQEPSVMAGVMDIDAADKIARFVRMCDCFNMPLVTLIDSPGFLPGVDQEHRGIIRHGAKVLYAFSEASVPKVSIITRKAYGGAYVVLSSKFLGTDVSYAWPSAEIAVMGAEGAVNILYRRQIASAADPEAERARLVEEYRKSYGSPFYAARAGYVDDVIEPRETRPKLVAALEALRDKESGGPARKHGNMPM